MNVLIFTQLKKKERKKERERERKKKFATETYD